MRYGANGVMDRFDDVVSVVRTHALPTPAYRRVQQRQADIMYLLINQMAIKVSYAKNPNRSQGMRDV
jgi:hypothetical protein